MLAALLAACLAFVTVEPGYAAPCPHHAPALALIANAQHMHGHASHAGHAGHADVSTGHGTHEGHHDAGGGCNCLDACCAAAAIALIEHPATVIQAVESAVWVVLPPRASVVADAAQLPPHSLPFSTAPPSVQIA